MKERLNLGSGKNPISDYWNVDLRANVGADEVADIRKIDYPPESFVEILASDVISHINPIEAKQLLRNCYRWLKPHGIIVIHTPNLRFLASILTERDEVEALKWMYGTAGDGTTNYPENHIQWNYSTDALSTILENIGFTIIQTVVTCNGYGFQTTAAKLNPMHMHEGHITSQNGEDGIIWYLFDKIGWQNKNAIEIGYSESGGNNVDLMVQREGWRSLVIDKQFNYPFIQKKNQTAITASVTAENVNELLSREGWTGEVDLFSLDVDGNDYWIWKALALKPRVVVVEYNASFGPEQSVTTKYNPDFKRVHSYYHGASLKALTKLATEKGYTLIGCDSCGCNAFYVRSDLVTSELPAPTVEAAYVACLHREGSWQSQWEQIKNLDYVEI